MPLSSCSVWCEDLKHFKSSSGSFHASLLYWSIRFWEMSRNTGYLLNSAEETIAKWFDGRVLRCVDCSGWASAGVSVPPVRPKCINNRNIVVMTGMSSGNFWADYNSRSAYGAYVLGPLVCSGVVCSNPAQVMTMCLLMYVVQCSVYVQALWLSDLPT